MTLKTIGKTLKNPLIKTIGSPIKDSLNMLRHNKNTIKNISSTFGDKYLGIGHVKHFVEEGIKRFRQNPQPVGPGTKFVRTEAKGNGQFGTTFMMGKNSKNYAFNKKIRQKHSLNARRAALSKQNLEKIAEAQSKVKQKMSQGKRMGQFARYTDWLIKKPLQSRIATSLVISTLGDFLCQVTVEEKGFGREKAYDYARTTRLGLIGGFIAGPMIYSHLNIVLPKIANIGFLKHSNHVVKTAACLIVDQTIWAYGINAIMLFQFHGCEHFDLKEAYYHQEKLMPGVIRQSQKVWPIVGAINLGLLPPVYRVTVNNVVNVFWNLYISKENHSTGNGMVTKKIG